MLAEAEAVEIVQDDTNKRQESTCSISGINENSEPTKLRNMRQVLDPKPASLTTSQFSLNPAPSIYSSAAMRFNGERSPR